MSKFTTVTCSPENFYLNIPLYEEVSVPEGSDRSATNIAFFGGPMDAYCEGCKAHSIFVRYLSGHPDSGYWKDIHRRDIVMHCSRDRNHELYFTVQSDAEARSIQKIGQFPSLATLSMYDVRKYGTVLENSIFRELKMAIGLAAHGIGIGSFVYMRRIFEGLVEHAHMASKNGAEWDEVTYGKARMADKIGMLSAFLPAFLVENKTMYGILSKGIHELTEQECLAAFPVVKVGIEIILDAKIEEVAARKKLETARLAIQKLASAVASPSGN